MNLTEDSHQHAPRTTGKKGKVTTDRFETDRLETELGCPLLSHLSNLFLATVMRELLKDHEESIKAAGEPVTSEIGGQHRAPRRFSRGSDINDG